MGLQAILDRLWLGPEPIPTAKAIRIPKALAVIRLTVCTKERAEATGYRYEPIAEGITHLCDSNGGWLCSWPPEER